MPVSSKPRLLLGLSGGIAAYKAAELTRIFVRDGIDVRVVMTEAACGFITPATMQALSGQPVHTDMWDARIADNAGGQPIDRPIVPGGPAAYFATLPIKAAVAALREAGLPAIVSNTAGTFVCNHVFYGLMHRAASSRAAFRGGLLHVPYLPAQAARIANPGGGAPSMTLADILRGIEIVLAVAASRTDDLGALEGVIS